MISSGTDQPYYGGKESYSAEGQAYLQEKVFLVLLHSI